MMKKIIRSQWIQIVSPLIVALILAFFEYRIFGKQMPVWLVLLILAVLWTFNVYLQRIKKDKNIEHHNALYITKKNDSKKTKFCSTCWGNHHKFIPVKCFDTGEFECPTCGTSDTYDKEKYTNYRISRRNIPKIRSSIWN